MSGSSGPPVTDNPQAKSPAIPELVKRTLGIVTGASVILYALGFIVIGIYLWGYGVSDINLFQARYVAVGLLFVICICFTSLPILFLVRRVLPYRKGVSKGTGEDKSSESINVFPLWSGFMMTSRGKSSGSEGNDEDPVKAPFPKMS